MTRTTLLPARCRFTNLAWQIDRDAALLALADDGCDVLFGVEARTRANKPVDVARALGSGWIVHQQLVDGEQAASFVAIRKAVLPAGATADVRRWVKIADGHKGTRLRTGLQDRYLLDVEVHVPGQKPLHLVVFHLPLASTGKRGTAAKKVHAHLAGIRARGESFVAAADVNMPPGKFAKQRFAWRGVTRWGFFAAGDLSLGPLLVDRSVTTGGTSRRLTDSPFLDLTVSGPTRTPTSPAPAPTPAPPKETPMATTANGHTVLSTNRTSGTLPRLRKWVVPGTGRHLLIRDGAMGFILIHVALWFHETVQSLNLPGQVWDEWGWAVRPQRGQTTGFSNHAGGAAIDLNATLHPRGVPVTRTMTAKQIGAIRARMAWTVYRGTVIWGGGWRTPDGMHFEIASVPLSRCELVAKVLARTRRGKRILAANPGAREVIWS